MRTELPLLVIITLFMATAAVLFASCSGKSDDDGGQASGDDSAGPDDTQGDSSDDDQWDDDTQETRSFYLAAAPMQYLEGDYSMDTVFDMTGFAGRVDLVSVQMDFFGIPWDEFAAGTDPPAAWVSTMQGIHDQLQLIGTGAYLSLGLLGGTRDTLAPKATEQDGKLVLVDNWAGHCYDLDTGADAQMWRYAYKAYARWLVDYFNPIFLTNVIEMNLFGYYCPDSYAPVISLANEVYDQEKAINPDLPIFPTLVIDQLYGYNGLGDCEIGDFSCLDASLATLADIKRDRIGISSYPLHMTYEWTQIPDDYFSLIHDKTGETLAFGETGYASYPVSIPNPDQPTECFQVFDSSDEDQTAYMQFLFDQAQSTGTDLVTWWSLRDYLPADVLTDCPCDAPGLWCTLYDIMAQSGILPAWLGWGSMGVLDHDLNPKASYNFWKSWLERPKTY